MSTIIDSVCLSVPMSVCLSVTVLQIDSSFLFLGEIEPFFDRHFSMCSSKKRCSSIFDLGPLTPKICTKSPISRLVSFVWQIHRRCLGLSGVFGDGQFNGTVQNVVGPTLVAMATKFELGAEIQSPTSLSVN